MVILKEINNMSIKVSDFDYQFFIKQQFILNIAVGLLGCLLLFSLTISSVSYIFFIFYILYFVSVIIVYIKYKDGRDLIFFSKHRIFGHYFVGSIFMVLALNVLCELGIFYLIIGFFLLFY